MPPVACPTGPAVARRCPAREGTAIGATTALRTTLVQGLPLVALDLAEGGLAAEVLTALEGAGLVALPGFVGVELPRGARIAVHVVEDELRLVDEAEVVLLRAPRPGLDPGWSRRARELRGTMFVVTTGLDLAPLEGESDLVAALEVSARDGRALGAIVGMHDEPRRLPLVFG